MSCNIKRNGNHTESIVDNDSVSIKVGDEEFVFHNFSGSIKVDKSIDLTSPVKVQSVATRKEKGDNQPARAPSFGSASTGSNNVGADVDASASTGTDPTPYGSNSSEGGNDGSALPDNLTELDLSSGRSCVSPQTDGGGRVVRARRPRDSLERVTRGPPFSFGSSAAPPVPAPVPANSGRVSFGVTAEPMAPSFRSAAPPAPTPVPANSGGFRFGSPHPPRARSVCFGSAAPPVPAPAPATGFSFGLHPTSPASTPLFGSSGTTPAASSQK